MPINVFGNSSNNSEKKTGTCLFVQKFYLRTKYIKNIIEEDIDLKRHYKIKTLPHPINIREGVSKSFVYNNFHDPSILKNTTHVDFKNKKLNKTRFIKVIKLPDFPEHLTAKFFYDQAISDGVDEPSLLKIHLDKKLGLDELDSIVFNSTLTLPKTIPELPNKSYVDSRLNDSCIIRITNMLLLTVKILITFVLLN